MFTPQDLHDRLSLVKREVEEVDGVEVTIEDEASLQETMEEETMEKTMEEEAGVSMEEGCSTAFRRRRLVVTPKYKRLVIASL